MMNGGMEIRIPEDADFEKLRKLCDETESWDLVFHKKNVRVWTQDAKESDLKMIRIRSEYSDVSASLVYDVLHDSEYRAEWDKYMMDCKEIGLLNPNNDVCYYAARSPTPLRHRDFVLQRSWLETGHEYMIFNHSVCHEDFPPRKGCVRAISFFTGYLARPLGPKSSQVTYISHSDPGGRLPCWLVNKLTQIIGPKFMRRLYRACLSYPSWKSQHDPHWKPWCRPDQLIYVPRIELSKCKPTNYDQNGFVDESQIVEEQMQLGIIHKLRDTYSSWWTI